MKHRRQQLKYTCTGWCAPIDTLAKTVYKQTLLQFFYKISAINSCRDIWHHTSQSKPVLFTEKNEKSHERMTSARPFWPWFCTSVDLLGPARPMTAAGAPTTIFKGPGALKKAFGNWPKAKKSGEVIHQVPTAMDVTKGQDRCFQPGHGPKCPQNYHGEVCELPV